MSQPRPEKPSATGWGLASECGLTAGRCVRTDRRSAACGLTGAAAHRLRQEQGGGAGRAVAAALVAAHLGHLPPSCRTPVESESEN